LLSSATTSLQAQSTSKSKSPPETSVEGRVDAIIGHETVAQAGVGLSFWAGTYTRLGIVGAIGGGSDGLSGRIDGFGRFHLDPFRESHWAPYGGAGLSTRFDTEYQPRAFLLVFAGVDGPVRHGLTTSFEAGLGGGARIGVIIRQAVAERR
jgi:hypothetical protein